MAKFKPGDRVRMASSDCRVPCGAVGTVLDDENSPDVKWDNWNKGHSGPYRNGGESVWTVNENDLELIAPEETPISDPEQETLRDRIAMIAMAAMGGMIAKAGLVEQSAQDIAKRSYEIADAMLKAREDK